MNHLIHDNFKENVSISSFDDVNQSGDKKIVKIAVFDGQAAREERERHRVEMEKIFGKQNWRSM